MLKNLLLFLFVTASIELCAQQNSDTIPISKLLKYELVKITEINRETSLPEKKELLFSIIEDQAKADYYKQKYKLNAVIKDTVITMDWDVEKNSEPALKIPDLGIFKLNKDNKVVIKKSRYNDVHKRVIVERKFKISKWEQSILILQDISDPQANRIYTFKRREQ